MNNHTTSLLFLPWLKSFERSLHSWPPSLCRKHAGITRRPLNWCECVYSSVSWCYGASALLLTNEPMMLRKRGAWLHPNTATANHKGPPDHRGGCDLGASSLSLASGLLLHWWYCSWRLQLLILRQDHLMLLQASACWCLWRSLLMIHTNKWTKVWGDAMSWMMACVFFSDEWTWHLSQYDTERPTHHVFLSVLISVFFPANFQNWLTAVVNNQRPFYEKAWAAADTAIAAWSYSGQLLVRTTNKPTDWKGSDTPQEGSSFCSSLTGLITSPWSGHTRFFLHACLLHVSYILTIQ